MIALENIGIRQGAFLLCDVSLRVGDGQYGVLMGPTGCGKTTLLEVICGLRRPEAGRVLLDGRDITHERPGARGIGYVPQDGALFPTMTVAEQLAFAPRLRRWPRRRIFDRVHELAVHLDIGDLLERLPIGLSGGERQRVAIGRALAARPTALLLDEPLSALDEDMCGGLRDLLKRTQREEAISVLHVTHDRVEAAHLGDVHFTISRDGTVTTMVPPVG